MFKAHAALALVLCALLLSCERQGQTAAPENADTEEAAATDDFNRGFALLKNPAQRSDYRDAIALLEKAVAQTPGNAQAQLLLAYAQVKRNQYGDAERSIAAARALEDALSTDDKLWLDALSARVQENHDGELKAWAALVAFVPDNRWAWYDYGAAYYVRGDYAKTVDMLEKALAVEPDPAAWNATYLHYLRSKSYYRIGDYEMSITAALPGLDHSESKRATFYRKLMAELVLGRVDDPDAAILPYRQAAEAEGRAEPYILAGIANFFFEAGDYERAGRYARQGFEMAKDAYPGWLWGYSVTESGDPEGGFGIIEDVLTLHPDAAGAHAGKGWALYRLSRYEEARAALLKAQALHPRHHFGVARDLAYVDAAIADPAARPAPPMRWWGD